MRNHKQNRKKGERGSVSVEAALSISFYLMLLLSIFEFGRVAHIMLAGNFAMSQASRWAAIGETVGNNDRLQSITMQFKDKAEQIGLQIDASKLKACTVPGVEDNYTVQHCTGLNNLGDSGNAFQLNYVHPVKVAFLMEINLGFDSLITNEPF